MSSLYVAACLLPVVVVVVCGGDGVHMCGRPMQGPCGGCCHRGVVDIACCLSLSLWCVVMAVCHSCLCVTHEPQKPVTPTQPIPYPGSRVRVLSGWDTGCPGNPRETHAVHYLSTNTTSSLHPICMPSTTYTSCSHRLSRDFPSTTYSSPATTLSTTTVTTIDFIPF